MALLMLRNSGFHGSPYAREPVHTAKDCAFVAHLVFTKPSDKHDQYSHATKTFRVWLTTTPATKRLCSSSSSRSVEKGSNFVFIATVSHKHAQASLKNLALH